jgi:hypothetical protein
MVHKLIKFSLKLKTIISLIPQPPSQELVDFCKVQHIHLRHFPVDQWKEDISLEQQTVANILEVFSFPFIETWLK